MADTKISNLTALAEAPATGDLLALVDVSASETKKLTIAYLNDAIEANANTFTAAQIVNVGEGIVGVTLQATGNTRAEIGTFSAGAANAGFVRLRDAAAITIVIDGRTDTAARHSYINNTSNFGLGTNAPTGGKLYVDQTSATGAIPVLYLDQGDADQDFIEIVGGSSTGNATSISTDAAGAYAGRMQITVNGTRRWISFTADA